MFDNAIHTNVEFAIVHVIKFTIFPATRRVVKIYGIVACTIPFKKNDNAEIYVII
jgi:hypothetical protein